jgi:ATP-binding cassette, subfamily C, type I secretion system permease/ATPase
VRRRSREPPLRTCPIARALRRNRRALLAAAALAGCSNVLALTGPLYMLAIYDRVLPWGRGSMLATLTLAMLALYALSGLLDFARLQVMGRVANRVDRGLSARVFCVQQALPLERRTTGDGLQPMRDLDRLRGFLASAGPTALFDLPWMPLYLGVIFFMHPLFGVFAAASALLLLALMLLAEALTSVPEAAATASGAHRTAFAAAARRSAEAACAMGFGRHLRHRWEAHTARHRDDRGRATRIANVAGAAIRAARPALQSGMMGLGAYLVLRGEASPGTMVAASIVLSRALAPIETAIAHWRGFVAARQARDRLSALLADGVSKHARITSFVVPRARLSVEHLSVAPPSAREPTLRGVTFALDAGAALGIIGPSASGKSTLARALVGVWRPYAGNVNLDGHALSGWSPDACGRHTGYLPQDVALIEGSIADNIARFDPHASQTEVVAAARAAGVHAMIEQLAEGYLTDIGESGVALSAGQRQRLGLARAIYGDPFVVVLDEPDANLDAAGHRAVITAIASVRARGGIAIVVAHRRTLLAAVDRVLVLSRGRVAAFGPRDSVLAQVLLPRHVAAAE